MDGFHGQAVQITRSDDGGTLGALIILPGGTSPGSEGAWLAQRSTWTFAAWIKCTACSSLYMEHGDAINGHHNTLHPGITGPFDNYPPGGGPTVTQTGSVASTAMDDIATVFHHVRKR